MNPDREGQRIMRKRSEDISARLIMYAGPGSEIHGKGDPMYNPNLTLVSVIHSLREKEDGYEKRMVVF